MRAFFDAANSTREGDAESIGEKGIGTMMLFNAHISNLVVSKSADEELYKVVEVRNPAEQLLGQGPLRRRFHQPTYDVSRIVRTCLIHKLHNMCTVA